MQTPSLILLSRQSALQRQVEVLANNIANANTTGFKAQQMLLQTERLQPTFKEELNFVVDRSTVRDAATGPMARTGNELDFALQGPGYFGIRAAEGVRYTRNGSFSMNSDGDLVNQDGLPVLSSDGQNITIPADANEITLDASGRLLTDKGEVGRLQVKSFANEQAMIEIGNGLYDAKQTGTDAEDTRVVQGAIEQSNVKPVVEMIRVNEAVRAYQQTATLLQSEHDRLRNAIRSLGRVGAV